MIKNNLKNSAIISYFLIVFNIISGLLYTPWMISIVGKNDYGIYILTTSFLAYFVLDYGTWQSINILISKYRSENKELEIEQTIGIATKLYLGIDILVSLILLILYFNLDEIFTNLNTEDLNKFKKMFVIASIFSVLNFPFNFLKGIMYAYEFVIQNRFFDLISKVCIIILTVIALSYNGNIYLLVFIYALIPLLKNIFMVIFLYKKGVKMKFNYWNKNIALSIFGLSIWLFLYVISELFINNISPIILSMKSTLDQVAIFSIGLTIFGYFYQINNVLSGFFLPKVSKMKHNINNNELYDYAFKINRFQILIGGGFIFGFIVSGNYFIKAWIGEDFVNSYYVAILMITPGIISYSQQVEQSKLYAENKVYIHSISIFLTAITSLSLSFYLIPKYGAIGAATSIGISNIIFQGLFMSIMYYKILNFNVFRFYKRLLLSIIIFGIISIITIIISNYINLHNNWLKFFFTSALYSFLYIISSYYLILDKNEKIIIKNKFYANNKK